MLWSLVVALLLYVAAELYETYTIFVVRRQRLLGVVPVLAGDKFELGEVSSPALCTKAGFCYNAWV